MDAVHQEDVIRRAQFAHRRAENALARMFGNFGSYEDDNRATQVLKLALAREQATWIVAFGSPKLRELAAQAEERDEAGRLARPWLYAAGAVEARLNAEWQRSPAWSGGARTPGQEWTAVPKTYDRPANLFWAFIQKQALARASAAAEKLWQEREKRLADSSAGRGRPAVDLHERLRMALGIERKAWVTIHGSRELKRMSTFDDGVEDAVALSGMRQLGSEWLAKQYPGWQFVRGFRADGHRSTLGSENNLWAIAPEHQRALEDALGTAPAASMLEAKHIDPKAEFAVFREPSAAERASQSGSAHSNSGNYAVAAQGPYVFAAVVERRLPGSWVKEPVILVFRPQQQRELNALAERELGVLPRLGEQDREDARSARRVEFDADGARLKTTTARQQSASGHRSASLFNKEGMMIDLRQERAEQQAAMRDALARQYHKPVLPVPQGACVEGMVVAVLGGEQAARMRAVVESDRALHIIGVGADTARETLGTRVSVGNERGKVTLTPSVQTRVDIDRGRQGPVTTHDRSR